MIEGDIVGFILRIIVVILCIVFATLIIRGLQEDDNK